MEIDALYCDVIVQRWEKLTNQTAVLDGEQKSFAQVASDRGVV